MSYKTWAVDASYSYPEDGIFCWVPYVEKDDRTFDLITGLMVLSDMPPHDGECKAIVHENGQEAVEQWMEEHAEKVALLRERLLAKSAEEAGNG